jgi:cyclophilin family peptidyl-prolyl cis-trans isomerase/HEAT repeat protein
MHQLAAALPFVHIYNMRNILSLALLLFLALGASSQVPIATGIEILKAEDARRYDSVLENLMKSPNDFIRIRAALAAGRIGDDNALPTLTTLLEKDASVDVRSMAAFAIGEVESVKGADPILKALQDPSVSYAVRSRAAEAAGKIVAADPKDEKSKKLGEAILTALELEYKNAQLADSSRRPKNLFLLELTAILRAKPDGADKVVAKLLTDSDPRIRSAAANTLTRLRAKNANEQLRRQLGTDTDAVARANAARALGAAEDKDALEPLLNAATKDTDLRVRVSAIRSVGLLKDTNAVPLLVTRGEALLAQMKAKSAYRNPAEKNELLEIITALAAILPNTENDAAVSFINEFRMEDGGTSPEAEVALAKIAPKAYVAARVPDDYGYRDFHMVVARARGLAHIAQTKDPQLIADAGEKLTFWIDGMTKGVRPADRRKMLIAMPELTSAMAELKPDDVDELLRAQLENDDLFVRSAAAGAIADRPKNNDNIASLKAAFSIAFVKDKHDNDAMLATMDALFKLDKNGAVGSLLVALSSPDYLVRKKAFELLSDSELQKANPGVATSLETARAKHRDRVLPYSPALGTRLGQVLNTDADYRRALMRKDGSVRAVLTTEKGVFAIEFDPEEAPLTVDNFVKLARAGYFNGLEVHRVVPNFVMQDGDPRGDGNGGPGWSIRCEINMLPYDRGAVGMALSGKDTGGSQWFVTHSPQPHLDGGYTVFGHVPEKDMHVVDSIVRGDRILSVKIIGATLPQSTQRTKRGK